MSPSHPDRMAMKTVVVVLIVEKENSKLISYVKYFFATSGQGFKGAI